MDVLNSELFLAEFRLKQKGGSNTMAVPTLTAKHLVKPVMQ